MIIVSEIPVSSTEIWIGGDQFHPLGLWSQVIFGPVKDYQCQCGKLQGFTYLGQRCPECNVLIGPSLLRRHVVSYIQLPFSIPNPLAVMFLIPSTLGDVSQRVADANRYTQIEEYIRQHPEKFEKFAESFPLFIDRITVIPPLYRPISQRDGIREMDRINFFYLSLLHLLNAARESLSHSTFTKFSVLRVCVNYYKYIIQLLSKKEGLIRQSILGKRNDFTGRSVIVIDPTLHPDEARIPTRMLVAALEPVVIYELSRHRDPLSTQKLVEAFIRNPDSVSLQLRKEIEHVAAELSKQIYILLNRQPTLHRPSIRAFKPKLATDSDAIAIPMLVTTGFNADFDGDTMAMYVPLTKAAQEEASKMTFSHNPLKPGSLTFDSFTQDLVIALWYVTSDPKEPCPDDPRPCSKQELPMLDPHTWIKWNGRVTTAGRAVVSELLGVPIDRVLGKSQLYDICEGLSHQLSPQDFTQRLYNLQRYLLPFTACVSISLKDLIVPPSDWKQSYASVKKWSTSQVKEFWEKMKNTRESLQLSSNIAAMIHSGARGNIGQWMQVVGLKGLVRNTLGKLITPPILSSLTEGLSPLEMVLSSAGNRKGAIDKALNTATAGYLLRKLVFSLQHLRKGQLEDCGTTRGRIVEITTQNKRKWIGRYTMEGERITRDNITSYIGKTVVLRSPLFCKSSDFCKRCYPYEFDFPGIVSAQSFGEVSLQLVMRTFHVGGAAEAQFADLSPALRVGDDDIVTTTTDCTLVLPTPLPIDREGIVSEEFDIRIRVGEDTEYEVTIPINTKWLLESSGEEVRVKANTPVLKIVVSASDLATDLLFVSRILGSNTKTTLAGALEALERLEKIYDNYHVLLGIHGEVLWSERMRNPSTGHPLRFTDSPIDSQTEVLLESISSLPHHRLLLSLCFENFRKFFLQMVYTQSSRQLSPLERLALSDLKGLRELRGGVNESTAVAETRV